MTGKDIRQKIEKSGVAYADLAKRLDVSPQTLNSRLKAHDLKLSFIEEVARAINKPLYYFFQEEPLSSSVNEPTSNYQGVGKRDDLPGKVVELERRLHDKDETILALKKLVAVYEQGVQKSA